MNDLTRFKLTEDTHSLRRQELERELLTVVGDNMPTDPDGLRCAAMALLPYATLRLQNPGENERGAALVALADTYLKMADALEKSGS